MSEKRSSPEQMRKDESSLDVVVKDGDTESLERVSRECKKRGFNLMNHVDNLYEMQLEKRPNLTMAQFMKAARKMSGAEQCMILTFESPSGKQSTFMVWKGEEGASA